MKITTGSSLKIQEGKALFQYLAALTCTITIITSGMHYGWPSPSLPKLNKETSFALSNSEGSWIAVMPLIGAIVGSLMVSVTVDILGRKRTIILSNFPYFASWVMVAFSQSVMVLNIARFIAGVADGWVFTAVPMYIGEIAEPRIRGLLGCGVSVTWILGTLLINIIGSYLSITVAALVCSILPIITLLTFCWMPESPYFLLMRNNYEAAKESLQTLRGLYDVESELNRLGAAVKAQMSNTGKFLDLVTVGSNRKAVAIMVVLRTTQQLSGTAAITFYIQPIFKEAGDDISAEIATIIYFAVQLTVSMFSSSIVDRTGRRPLLIASIIGSASFLFVEGTYFYLKSHTSLDLTRFTVVPVVALICYIVIYAMGMQNIPLLMLGEVFPANVKAFALCLSDIYFAIIATIVSKFFQIVKDNFAIFVPFYVFSLCSLLGLVCVVLFVPETKGKTLELIQMNLKGQSEEECTRKNEGDCERV